MDKKQTNLGHRGVKTEVFRCRMLNAPDRTEHHHTTLQIFSPAAFYSVCSGTRRSWNDIMTRLFFSPLHPFQPPSNTVTTNLICCDFKIQALNLNHLETSDYYIKYRCYSKKNPTNQKNTLIMKFP